MKHTGTQPRRGNTHKSSGRWKLYLVAIFLSSAVAIGLRWLLDVVQAEPVNAAEWTHEQEINELPPDDSDGSDEAWQLTLVNAAHPLEEPAAPELTELEDGHTVDSRIYTPLMEMLDAAEAEGLSILVCSAYRTQQTQEELFGNKVDAWLEQGKTQEEAERLAGEYVARPGTSEHQLGLAVDLVSASNQMLDETQEDTPEQKWLMEHCWDFGFILRYPTDKSDITGISYEPWHYRYVGKTHAAQIHRQGICLEEYIEQLYG